MTHRLLATDPDPVLLELYMMYFGNFDVEVAAAGDAVECVNLLDEFAPDVLVLSRELRWGGADGVIAILAEQRDVRPMPVILTCGALDWPKADNCLVPPVVNLLQKPFHLYELRMAVEEALHTPLGRFIA